ncbi:DUF2207 domain-containing protein, partial [Roseibium hamelinense]|nr:DUF2207 domain-containing protein [Roseibium hamelinense]
MRFSRIASHLFALVAVLFLTGAGVAEERILQFHSDMEVRTDGQLLVTERITVRAEGNQIRRGIFRDIPLRARDANGWIYEVGFELLDVEQDGQRASYFTEDSASGVRIYIGRSNVFLDPGKYTYTIQYLMDRQVRFFGDYDEIYWNVTGNEWAFPIDQASARVTLPEGAEVIQYQAYTGVFGADGSNYEAEVDQATGQVVFQTIRPLQANEGMTVAVGFQKGIVAEPAGTEKLLMWLQDQRVFAIGASGVLVLSIYYVFTWWRVGRDPAKGVIFPRFKAPDDISPALANYITNRGIEGGRWTALTAACLNLAIKGRLQLNQDGKTMVLELPDMVSSHQRGELPKGEAVVEDYLHGRGAPLPLDKENGKSVSALGDKFVGAISKEYRGVYFRRNGLYLLPGLAISILTIVLLIRFGNLSEPQFVQAFLFGFFTIFAIAISFGLSILVQSLLEGLSGSRLPALGYWLVFAVILGSLIYLVSLLVSFMLGSPHEIPLLPVFVLSIVAMFFVYASVIDVPTAHGRQVMDAIDGLKLYLSVAEKDRLNMSDAPDMSVLHFENLLPYAVSLGVEKPWATHFETWLSSAVTPQASQGYQPSWYRGPDFDSRNISRSIGTTASAMAGSFQSSLPVSSSSSSGSSGGGS